MTLVFKQLVAVIDDRTTFICIFAAGQIREPDEPYDADGEEIDEPPLHINCRSLSVPYMPGFVNTQRTEANKELQRRPKEKRRPGSHARVPLSYQQKIDKAAIKRVMQPLTAEGQKIAAVLDDLPPKLRETTAARTRRALRRLRLGLGGSAGSGRD